MFETTGVLKKDLVYRGVRRSMQLPISIMMLLLWIGALLLLVVLPLGTGMFFLSALLFTAICGVGYFAQCDNIPKAAVAKIEPFYGAPEPEITTRFTEQEIAVFCGEVQVLSLGYDQLRSIRKIDAVYLLQSSAGQYCYVFGSALSAEERRAFLRFLKTKTPGLLGLGGLLREEGA